MKKFTRSILLLFCLIAFIASANSQVLWFDWESPEKTPTDVSFDTNGGSYAVVDNLVADGINTSAKAGLAHTSAWEWDGFGFDVLGNFDFTSTYTFTMMVKSDTQGEVLFKIKGNGQDDKEVRFQEHTGSGIWELLTFDFTTAAPANDAYNRIEIIFNASVSGEGDWYFDNITVPGVIGPDGLVELTFMVTDKMNSTSMSVDFDGNNIALTNDNGIWKGKQADVPIGNYTWDLNVDGSSYKTGIALDIEVDKDFYTAKYKLANSNLIIGKVATPPTIDGVIDGLWNNVAATAMNNVFNGGFDDAADHSASFKAVWDATNLYVLVEITDQTLVNSTGGDYERDCAELLIDIDNAGGTNYDNDKQIRYIWNDADYNNGKGVSAQADVTGGWLIEIALPWTYLDENYTAVEGALIGMDVSSTDNDATNREGTHAWMATEDNGWWNPSVFGQVELGMLISTDISEEKAVELLIYPNPATDVIRIANINSTDVVEVFNPLGNKVKEVIAKDGMISIADLAAGIYMVKVNETTVKIIKK